MRSVFRPLIWTGPITPDDKRRSRHTFSAGFSDTVYLVDYEVEQLGADEYVIEADFAEKDIRLDGMPRASARQPGFPGIRISFGSKFGPLQYQTDSCVYWQHNLRSIGLGLQALRAVKRYGIAEHGEQYRGYRAIEGALPVEIVMTYDEALIFMSDHSGYPKEEIVGMPVADLRGHTPEGRLRQAYKRAARKLHPDSIGGSEALMARLNQANEVLRGGL